jgi:uncharacterized protein
MITEPHKRIPARGLLAWRISGTLHSVFPFVLSGGAIAAAILFNWPIWVIGASLMFYSAYAYLVIMTFPSLRWKRWRYEVRENEIELKNGLFVIKRTLVPMIRVQHVDTRQGPILRKYRLATVTISTAATIHEIPALDVDEAEELRFFISQLARAAENDV